MIIITCIDEERGMMFNHRRQSQDRLLREDIIRECQDHKLFMNKYSFSMFGEQKEIPVIVSEEFLGQAGEHDYCFVENQDMNSFMEYIEKVILYRWNRRYPADTYLMIDLWDGNWILEEQKEFKGSSHENITREVYKRKNEK